jgi:hypothetical protein
MVLVHHADDGGGFIGAGIEIRDMDDAERAALLSAPGADEEDPAGDGMAAASSAAAADAAVSVAIAIAMPPMGDEPIPIPGAAPATGDAAATVAAAGTLQLVAAGRKVSC